MKIEVKGLDSMVARLEKQLNLAKNMDKIAIELCELGAEEVRKAHSGVMGIDHVTTKGKSRSIAIMSDADVRVESNDNIHSVVASGQNFLFFEFGAGIKRNNPRHWKNILDVSVPIEISDIGTYGKGYGSNMSWRYSANGESIITGGYEAKHGFANAINKIVSESEKIIKEAQDE